MQDVGSAEILRVLAAAQYFDPTAFSSPCFHIDDIVSQFDGFAISRKRNVKSFVWFESMRKVINDSPNARAHGRVTVVRTPE